MANIKYYAKKTVVIEALKFEDSPQGITELQEFCGEFVGRVENGEAEILTLEDGENLKVTHIATVGDYIIKGVEGEFYACKPNIFAKTYEEVTLPESMQESKNDLEKRIATFIKGGV